jgi:hypothetical protein
MLAVEPNGKCHYPKKKSEEKNHSRLTIPLGLSSADEKLASIGVGASVGHGQNA